MNKALFALWITLCGCSAGINTSMTLDGGSFSERAQSLSLCSQNTTQSQQFICIEQINETSVDVFTNALTWVSSPETLYVAAVNVVGCEAQRSERTFIAVRESFPRWTFTMVSNGAVLVDTYFKTINTPRCLLDGRAVSIQVYSVRDNIPRQELSVDYIP